MAKKKLKIKSKLLKASDGLNTPIKGTKEQYQAYQDSLDLYTANRDRLLQLERESRYATNMFGQSGLYNNGLLSEHYTYLPPHRVTHNQYSLTNVPSNYENGNDRTYWGFENRRSNVTINPITYHGFDRRFRQNVIRGTNQTVNLPGQNDLHEYAGIWQFPQPVQPIIYQPEERINERQNPMEEPWHPLYSRYETDKKVDALNPMLLNQLQGNNQQLEFNPIGFQKGSYFTRPKQSQEIGDKLEYFDKKTGRKLFQTGGEFKDPRQDSYYTPSSSDIQNLKFEYNKRSGNKGTIANPINKSEVEISAKRQLNPAKKAFSTVYPDKTGSSTQLAKDLFLTPLMESLSLPSQGVAQGINYLRTDSLGNYGLTPSQALGYGIDKGDTTYSYGRNFAIDAALDPLMWIGIGESARAIKGRYNQPFGRFKTSSELKAGDFKPLQEKLAGTDGSYYKEPFSDYRASAINYDYYNNSKIKDIPKSHYENYKNIFDNEFKSLVLEYEQTHNPSILSRINQLSAGANRFNSAEYQNSSSQIQGLIQNSIQEPELKQSFTSKLESIKRPQTGFTMNPMKADYLQSDTNTLQPILTKYENPVPFKGKFTRPKQSQEIGNTDIYTYDRLGNKIQKQEFGGQINELDMAKNGKKIKMKLKKADIGKFIPTSDGNIYNEFGVEEVPQSLQEDQYDPITGQKFDQFNPALTFGLQNYYQSKGKNAPAYLNNQEANQYADYVNTQPKQQNINNNTFANNVAPNLPTQGLFNNFYLNKADHYRKQAINSFSKLGQARYGKQLPKAQFGGNDYANLGSGIANAVTADINTVKGYTDIFGTLDMNSQIAPIEAQNKRQNLVSQFENPTPTFQNGWGGNNPLDNGYIPVGEYGMSIKEIGGQGQPNIEVEGKEHIQLPNGFSQEIQGNSHAEGGIPLNLPQDSKVFSEKLKHPEMKKSYAKMAKKFETKKDFKQLENPTSSKLNKSTAELNIKLKNQGLDELFMEQEMNKMEGVHGEIPQKETMKDYEMKYGGIMPETAKTGKLIGRKARIKAFQDALNNQQNSQSTTDEQYFGQNTFDPTVAQTTNIVTNNQPFQITPPVIKDAYSSNTRDPFSFTPFKTQNGIITPQNVNLNAAPETDYESHAQALEKLRGSKFKDFTEYQDYSYSEALKTKEGQAAINKMWLANGLTNKEESKFPDIAKKIKAQQALTPEELTKIKTNFVDGLPGKRIINYTGATTPAVAQTPPADRDSTIPSTIPSQQAEKLNRLKGFNSNITGLQLPDAYLRDPITVNNLQPEYYQPNTITPYLNDIQRLQYATNTNLGTSGADLASRANSFGQGLTEYGKRYYDASTYNAGVKTQASKDNALTKLNTNQFNNSNYINNARNPQLQREAVITEQKRLDKEAQLKTFADKEHEQMVMNYLGDIYDPNYALNANYIPTKKVAKFGTKLKPKRKK